MAQSPISVQEDDGVTVVSFPAETQLDLAAIEHLGDDLDALLTGARRGLILDFHNVHHVSSPALSLLLNLRRSGDAAGLEVVFVGLRPEVARLFRITRLDKLFVLCGSLAEARAHFQPRGNESSAAD
jgi:anti-anti-sigma factor